MKTIKLFTLLAALLCTTTSTWATDYNVGTDAELRAAVQNDGANITVTADIDLSNSTLSIATNTTVTIDLGGHTLDRKLTQRGEGGGQVITVRSGATLNLSNGTLKGGWGGDSGGINNEGGTANLTNVTITGCTGDDRGGAICNRSGSTLTMTGGSITNNISYDHTTPEGGGGIFNADGATATLTNVTITGNEAKVKGGGGICNYGTMTIDGCIIQDNIANMNGGGVWNGNDATLSINGGNISGNTADDQGGGIYTHSSFSMQGSVNITGNNREDGVNNNAYLTPDAVIAVTGALTGSSIGITMENSTGTFTSGYNTYNAGVDPATLFSADLPEVMAVTMDGNNEAQLESILPEGSVYYIERSWDDTNKTLKAEVKTLQEGDYTVLNGGGEDLTIDAGTYVVKGEVDYNCIYTANGGKHSIILCDGAKLSAYFIRVDGNNELDIYGQEYDTGELVIDDETFGYHAGIGGDEDQTVGTIVIHGGNINTLGCTGGSGIGAGWGGQDGTIVIYGGKIYAEGGGDDDRAGAGIGGGDLTNGTITIYGGNIEAVGNINHGAAGIGSSNYEKDGNIARNSGVITINGGNVTAKAGYCSAGIGGGANDNGAHVTINGGVVKAYGSSNGAGIGCGYNSSDVLTYSGELIVTGGEVYAYGSDRGGDDGGGAGIGGGRDADGSKVTISGGYVYAEGGKYAAGIGSGCEALTSGGKQGGSLTVTGGYVEAYGGEDAAGIGGGEDADGGTVTISGGYVYAKGMYGGAGIGGGEGGDGAHVTITGGTVHASAGSGGDDNNAIGAGVGSDENGSLTIGDKMSVRVVNGSRANKDQRVSYCREHTDVHVEPCTHPDATYTDNDSNVNVDCIYCSTGTMPYTFNVDGNWNDGTKWLGSLMPHDGNDVAVKADATIPGDYTANVGNIDLQEGGSITIARGGQLIHGNEGVTACVKKMYLGYTGNGGYYLISNPVAEELSPNAMGLLAYDYDLYSFDQREDLEWRNHKQHGFNIVNGTGYLYATSTDNYLAITGTLKPALTNVSVPLDYDAGADFDGFNLVGNPFVCNAYLADGREFYVLNGDGDEVVLATSSVIPRMQGIFVQAANEDDNEVTFTCHEPTQGRSLTMSLAKNDGSRGASTGSAATIIDNARIRFDEGRALEKFQLDPNHSKLYIPQEGKDYAVAVIASESEAIHEQPINFKAQENGTYTLSFNLENVEFDYLHLIDNLTGADIDLLHHEAVIAGEDPQSPALSYTFTAKTTDYESRFSLVFASNKEDGSSTGSENFAFYSNGNWFIANESDATLQVIDVTGRILSSETISGSISKTIDVAPGVYILKLNDKVQKIVIR